MPRPSMAEEAILLASSNTAVADYLVNRGTDGKGSIWNSISAEAEAKLLDRADRLIDLRLAEYCQYPSTARTLLNRDPKDWALRSLVLSNIALTHSRFMYGFPEHLFGSEEALKDFLSTTTPDDLVVLFANPTLDDKFLEQVLGLGDCWQAIPKASRPYVLSSLADNVKMQSTVSTSDHSDGWDWYMAGRPFHAAWQLLINLEVTPENVRHLSQLYEKMARYCPNREGISSALPRWVPQSDEESALEIKENERERASDYQIIRLSAAAMLLSQGEEKQEFFLESEDVAIRGGAYAAGKFSPEEMSAAIERDGWFATASFIRNPNSWKTDDHRLELANGIKSCEHETISWIYERHQNKYEADHPDWFDVDNSLYATDDPPLSEVSLGDLSKRFTSSPAVVALNAKIQKLANTQQLLLWLLFAVMVLQLFRR